jgi:hypothetical protein
MEVNMKVSLHHFVTEDGRKVEYARIQKWVGNTLIGQSLLLCRLSPEQLALFGPR